MTFKPNWWELTKKAYSVRWMAAAFIFTGAEIALPIWAPEWMPRGVFAALSGLATGGAYVFRLIAQANLPGEP